MYKPKKIFEPTYRSLSTHKIPGWYSDAKLGIFIHWGLYSEPAWAEPGDINNLIREKGHGPHFFHNPYSEWYMNTSRLDGSPAQKFHQDTYGKDFDYYDFRKSFTEKSRKVDMGIWADLFQEAGAEYAVMVTKHHDGYCLWPSKTEHPYSSIFHSSRDFVGELTDAVRDRGMKMGFYYSGVLDWSVLYSKITNTYSLAKNFFHGKDYVSYAVGQLEELIHKYKPSILWNDIGFPVGADLHKLFATYYNNVPEGVINDRWTQEWIPRNPLLQPIIKLVCRIIDKKTKQIEFVEDSKTAFWYDYNTPEYRVYDEVREKKWETVRGLGHSFAYNRQEKEEDMLCGSDLIHLLVDTVSKNGNLLINIGPRADGTIPESQTKPLKELGLWMSRNKESIHGTKPFFTGTEILKSNPSLRFTVKGRTLYVFDFDGHRDDIIIKNFGYLKIKSVERPGYSDELKWKYNQGNLIIQLNACENATTPGVIKIEIKEKNFV